MNNIDILLAIAKGEVSEQILAEAKLTKRVIALLIVRTVNPHRRLTVGEEAELAGVNPSTIHRRK